MQVKAFENNVFVCDPWIGICTWIGGHKYTFLCTGGVNGLTSEETWTRNDLIVVEAEVIGK